MSKKLTWEEREVELEKIKWSRERAGSKLEPHEFLVLKKSIESLGLLHPIIVAQCGDELIGVSGYNRWRALLDKGVKKAVVRVIPCDEKLMILTEIVENYGRGRGDDWGLLKRLAELTEKYKMSLEEISEVTGYSVSTLSKMLRVYKKAPPYVLDLIKKGKLGIWHALELLRLKDPVVMCEYARIAAENNYSVRQLKETIDRYLAIRETALQQLQQQAEEIPAEEPPQQYIELPVEQAETTSSIEIDTGEYTPETQEPPQQVTVETSIQQEPQQQETSEQAEPSTQQQAEQPKCIFCGKTIKDLPLQATAHKNCLITAAVILRKLSELMDKPVHKLKPAEAAQALDQVTELALKYIQQQEQQQQTPEQTTTQQEQPSNKQEKLVEDSTTSS